MTGKFDYFYKCQQYNKKKKPWRRFESDNRFNNVRRGWLKQCLCLFTCLEAVVLLPQYKDTIASFTQRLIFVSQEDAAQEQPGEVLLDRKAGETKEQGLSVDWKEGTVKFWQKVERVFIQEPD